MKIPRLLSRVSIDALADSAEKALAAITRGWNTQHRADGTHGAITAASLTLDGPDRETSGAWLSPPTLTVSVNDYAPTGWEEARVIRLESSGAVNITGWVARTVESQRLWLVNVGANNITLTHADAASLTRNQFLCPGSANLVLNANDSVPTWYDLTTERWRVLGV